MTIQTLAANVDAALANLVTAIDALDAEARTRDTLHRAQNNGHPSPVYESIGDKLVAAAGSLPTLYKHMAIIPVTHGPKSLASMFPAGD